MYRNSLVQFTGTATVNKEMYIVILRRLRDAIRRKHAENSCFLPHYNPPAHRSILLKDLLAKDNVTTLEHTPYSLDLVSADFYLFP
jgi:hypothetical protein